MTLSVLNLVSLGGMIALCGIAWLGSEQRRRIPWKVIFWGLGLQLILGALVFWVPMTRSIVELINTGVNSVLDAVESGARFVFGPVLVPDTIAPPGPTLAGRWIARAITPPYIPVSGDRLSPDNLNLGYIFAFRALPSVIFFSALMGLCYALGLIQPIVNLFAKIFRKTMNLSGAEALSGAANIFVGIEATLVIRPYLATMTRSELCAILASCFGSIASTVLALYSQLLRPTFPNITGHLVSASVMAIPACFVMAKILVPETDVPKTLGVALKDKKAPESSDSETSAKTLAETLAETSAETSAEIVAETPIAPPTELQTETAEAEPILGPMESIVQGAMDGAKLAIAIAALLIAILGLVSLANLFFTNLASLSLSPNAAIASIGRFFKIVSLQNILGFLFVPLTFLTGATLNPAELWQASVLLGQRLIMTEVPSYQQLGVLAMQGSISDRTLVVISYALCGFAHLPSVGIFAGGLIGLVPSRRKDITSLVWKALWAATLATLMIGCVAGVFDLGNPSVLGRQ